VIAQRYKLRNEYFYVIKAVHFGDRRQGDPINPLHDVPCLNNEVRLVVCVDWPDLFRQVLLAKPVN